MAEQTTITRRNFLTGAAQAGLAAVAGYHIVKPPVSRGYAPENGVLINLKEFEEQQRQKQQKLREQEAYESEQKRQQELENQELQRQKIKQERQREYLEQNCPNQIKPGQGSERFELARVIWGEGREFYPNLRNVNPFGNTVLTRKDLSGTGIIPVVYDSTAYTGGRVVHQFSCFNSADFKGLRNPLEDFGKYPEDYKAWLVIYGRAGDFLRAGLSERMTHFYTDTVPKPNWAKGKTPVRIITANGKTTRFYNLGGYEPNQISPFISRL